MANVNSSVTSDGNLIARIDNGDASNAKVFRVEHNGGGPGKELFEVSENQKVIVQGRIYRDTAITLNNTTTGDIARFQASGGNKAVITETGIGDFSFGGVRLRVLASDTDAGSAGDLALLDLGLGDLILHFYNASASQWQPMYNA